MKLQKETLIILSPAFPGNESAEQSPWLPAQQSLIRCINRSFPSLRVVIIAFKFPAQTKEYKWMGNHVVPLAGANKKGRQYIFTWVKAFNLIRRIKKTASVKGIISFWCNECCLVGSYFSKLYNIRHLCWICGQDARAGNKFVKCIRPRPGELAAMSDFLMETFYKNHSIRPQHLIADGIDATLFAPVIPVRDIDILGAGNLVPLKRYHIFINVVSVLAATGVVQKATLCGSGTEEHLLKQQVAGAGLQNIVEFTGLIPHAGVLQYMQRAKVFLHTSEYEGFGNVCIEALYAGAHVISFTRPMRQHIPHWHIVSTVGEMIEKAMDLLQQPATVYSPVLPFDMNDSAKQFIQLLAGDNI